MSCDKCKGVLPTTPNERGVYHHAITTSYKRRSQNALRNSAGESVQHYSVGTVEYVCPPCRERIGARG